MKSRKRERGQVLLFTGDGKGKTSAAMGTVLRLAGHGKRVLVVQFAKSPGSSGEQRALRKLAPRVVVKPLGTGRLDLSAKPRRKRDLDDVAAQWERALKLAASRAWGAVVFDELNFVVCAAFLPVERVTRFLDARPHGLTVVLTGRGRSGEIIRRADTVTEMRKVKHAFDAGRPAQAGIEY